MGRTLPAIAQLFMQEQEAFSRFRRALRRSDQIVLDSLFSAAQQHLSAAAYAAHALPFETFLLAMLLEEHKEVLHLRTLVERALEKPLEETLQEPLDNSVEGTPAEPLDSPLEGPAGD